MQTFKAALGILLFCAQVIEVNTSPFDQFYPEYEAEFTAILASNCSSIFHQYQNTSGSARNLMVDAICHQVVDCVLSNSFESTKANMASAGVVLGLLPTILALLGSTTPELSLLSSRRPLLAFLLSIGAPAVSPVRIFMFHDPVAALRTDPSEPTRYTKIQTILIVLLEYLATGAAVTNVWTLSWQLGQKTIIGISCGITWFQMLWVGLAAGVHLGGTLAFATRSETTYLGEETNGASFFQRMRAWVKRWPRNEFSPCVTHTSHIFSYKKENYGFILISWCVSVCTVAHIVWGTAVFSSQIFIGKYPTLPSYLYNHCCCTCYARCRYARCTNP
jgi:hypothetical protein